MPLRSESQLEKALHRKQRNQHVTYWIMLFSLLLLAVVFTYTALNFDALYDPYRSVYPRLSTVFSPLNMVVITLVASLNGFSFYKLRHAKAQLALSAYMLVAGMKGDEDTHPAFLNDFLKAAGLPLNYSLSLVKKMNMRHFMSSAGAINRAIRRHEKEWIALSRQV